MDISQFFSTQALMAGMAVGAGGILIAALRNTPIAAYKYTKRKSLVEVDVQSGDQLFDWTRTWFDAHPYSKKARSLSATTERNDPGIGTVSAGNPGSSIELTGNGNPVIRRIALSPAPGLHLFFHKRRPIWVHRERSRADRDGRMVESFKFITFGRSQQPIRELLAEIEAANIEKADPRISIYTSTWNDWMRVNRTIPRSLDTVILNEGEISKLVADLEKFRSSKAWYQSMGIPWKRGYLLHGLPGSGKTSLVKALAGHLKLDLYQLDLGSGNDNTIRSLLGKLDENSIVLLEDIDAAFNGRESTRKEKEETITFSGLLNSLDGVMAKEGTILIMTTNHIEKLDPALIRPGRIDVKIEFHPASNDQLIQLYLRFRPDDYAGATVFALTHGGQGKSMAAAQEILLKQSGQVVITAS